MNMNNLDQGRIPSLVKAGLVGYLVLGRLYFHMSPAK
jgi:hypothetical protein